MKRLWVFDLFAALLVSQCSAGAVRDASGGLAPGAKLTLTNLETAITATTITDVPMTQVFIGGTRSRPKQRKGCGAHHLTGQ